ncbi:MAG: DUF1588 domain-containing protein [Verrucomicrobiales bacterium]
MKSFLLYLCFATLIFSAPDGEKIYREQCASCHGEQGEGVDSEYDEALTGTRSIESLARVIHKTMPEGEDEACVDEDAHAVAQYIHEAFYSPEAQARLNPPRVELLRLTEHQYRHALTDLVASFRWTPSFDEQRGLRLRMWNAEKMNNRKEGLLDETSANLSLDLAKKKPHEKLKAEGFSALWEGSLVPPHTGPYQFRIKTPNGVRLHVNRQQGGDPALIDGWVSSNNTMRTLEGKTFLMAGHPVHFLIDYRSFQEKTSSIHVEWKPPHGTWQSIPAEYLRPKNAPPALIVSTPFPADDASLGYERGSAVSKAWQEAVTNGAIFATQNILADLDKLARTKKDDKERAEKIKKFCHLFAERAFARPLSPALKEEYVERHFKDSDPEEAAKRAILLTLISPRFLYPNLNVNEQGQPDQFSTAAFLSYALLDSLPPKFLSEQAHKKQLGKPEEIEKAAARLLEDPRAKHKINRFFYHWLGLSERNDLSKDPKLFPGFDEATQAELRHSLDQFINDIVWSEASDYRQLFRSPHLHLTQRLQKIYGPGTEKTEHGGLVADKRRAGLLTHPYVLAALSYHNDTSPIHRGVFLSRNVLGRFLKPPPEAIAFEDTHFADNLTMREKVTELTKKESCMACHEVINPVGFSLEKFDAIGRFRQKDRNQEINTTSEYPTETAEMIKISGPSDLADLAVQSPGAHRAFINGLFHHLVSQSARAYGSDTIYDLRRSFDNDFHIRKLLIDIAVTAAPKEEKKEEKAPQKK